MGIYSCILIFSSDGQKMSKRKKNYPDPMAIVNSYGADALRYVFLKILVESDVRLSVYSRHAALLVHMGF